MKEIIKYQLKDRKGFMLLVLSVFGVLNLIAFAIELYAVATGSNLQSFDSMLWVVVAAAATAITTIVMFFLCGSGHVDSLLYKDTSYLMLTIPRAGWEIVGGRFVAGLIEFLAYFGSACVLALIHIVIVAFTGSVRPDGVFKFIAAVFDQIFILNFPAVLQILVLAFLVYALIGMAITFAVVASRSFLKSKRLATVSSIAIFFIITRWATRFGQWLSEKFDWFWKITIVADPNRSEALRNGYYGMPDIQTSHLSVPVAQIALGILLTAGFFWVASWLMEKKVEL
jgi:hypothetical protein